MQSKKALEFRCLRLQPDCRIWRDENFLTFLSKQHEFRINLLDISCFEFVYQARALRALGLLLADGTPSGRGEDFLTGQPDFFTETAVTPERKVEKWFPRWEINRHAEG